MIRKHQFLTWFDPANTLRMLYQAQKEPITFSPSSETVSSTLEFTEPETHDPRQQTLLKFFRPTKAPTSSLQADMRNCSIGNGSKFSSVPVQSLGIQYECDHNAAISGSSTPSSTGVMDIDMRTDASSNTGYSAERRWFGSAGWAWLRSISRYKRSLHFQILRAQLIFLSVFNVASP